MFSFYFRANIRNVNLFRTELRLRRVSMVFLYNKIGLFSRKRININITISKKLKLLKICYIHNKGKAFRKNSCTGQLLLQDLLAT